MHKIFVTAIREFKSTALTPAFLIATFVIPVLFYGVFFLVLRSGALDSQPPQLVGVVGIIDHTESGAIATELASHFEPERQEERRQQTIDRAIGQAMRFAEHMGDRLPESQIRRQIEIREPPVAEVTVEVIDPQADIGEQRQRVRSGELRGLVVTSLEMLSDYETVVDVIVSAELERKLADQIESGAREAVVSARFAEAGIDREEVRDLSGRPRANRVTLTENGETKSGKAASVAIPLASIMLLLMAIFTGSGYLLMSTVEEKSTRVIEVLLSAISPMQLMAGKILGQAFVGFAVLVAYGGFGLLAAKQFGVLQLISPATIALLAVYFVIGYFMFASLFVAIGSSVNEMREAQAMQGPVFLVAFLFIYLGVFSAMNDPNSLMTRALSFFPLALPFIMPMRLGNPGDPPPMWEIPATIAVGVISVVFMLWASAKIFRIGVLMYGKPPNLIELAKMVRQA